MDAITESDVRAERGKENYYSSVNYATENYRTEDYGFKRDYSQYGNGGGAYPYVDRTCGERTELNDCTDMNESLYSTSILTHTSVRGSVRGRDEDAPRRLDYFNRNY